MAFAKDLETLLAADMIPPALNVPDMTTADLIKEVDQMMTDRVMEICNDTMREEPNYDISALTEDQLSITISAGQKVVMENVWGYDEAGDMTGMKNIWLTADKKLTMREAIEGIMGAYHDQFFQGRYYYVEDIILRINLDGTAPTRFVLSLGT